MQSYSCLILHFISLQMQKKTCTPSLVSIELKTKLWSGQANNRCYCHESNPFVAFTGHIKHTCRRRVGKIIYDPAAITITNFM